MRGGLSGRADGSGPPALFAPQEICSTLRLTFVHVLGIFLPTFQPPSFRRKRNGRSTSSPRRHSLVVTVSGGQGLGCCNRFLPTRLRVPEADGLGGPGRGDRSRRNDLARQRHSVRARAAQQGRDANAGQRRTSLRRAVLHLLRRRGRPV